MKKISLGTILALCWITRIVGFGVAIGGFAFLDYNLPYGYCRHCGKPLTENH